MNLIIPKNFLCLLIFFSSILYGNVFANSAGNAYNSLTCEYDQASKSMRCDYQNDNSINVKSLTLKVDGKEVQIPENGVSRYPAENQKTAILFMVDISDPRRKTTVENRNSRDILDILSLRKPSQEVGVSTFDSNLEVIIPIGDDIPGALNSVLNLKAKGRATEFYKSILDGISVLEKANASRKILVVMSDGKDEDRAYKLEDVVKAANKANVQILSLGYAEIPADTPYLQTLKKLADETQGKYINVPPSGLSREVLQRIFDFADTGGRVVFDATPFYSDRKVTLGLISEKGQEGELEAMASFPDNRSFVKKVLDLILNKGIYILIFLLLGALVLIAVRKFNKSKPICFAALDAMDGSGGKYSLFKDATRIGRGSDNEISLKNDSISLCHAEIHKRRDGGVFIVDLASTNGVYVNNIKVAKEELKSGDLIELGEVRFRFNLI